MCLLAQSWHNGYLIAMKFVWYKCYKLSTIIAEAVLQFLVMSLSELFLCSLTCLCPVLCCYLCSRTQGLWERERELLCEALYQAAARSVLWAQKHSCSSKYQLIANKHSVLSVTWRNCCLFSWAVHECLLNQALVRFSAQLMTQQVLEDEWKKDGDNELSSTVKKHLIISGIILRFSYSYSQNLFDKKRIIEL